MIYESSCIDDKGMTTVVYFNTPSMEKAIELRDNLNMDDVLGDENIGGYHWAAMTKLVDKMLDLDSGEIEQFGDLDYAIFESW